MSNAPTATVRARDLAPGQTAVHPSRPDTVFDPPSGSSVTLDEYLIVVDRVEADAEYGNGTAPVLWYREPAAPDAGPWGCVLWTLDDHVEVLR